MKISETDRLIMFRDFNFVMNWKLLMLFFIIMYDRVVYSNLGFKIILKSSNTKEEIILE